MLFGFVNVYKNELKIKDYNLFKAYYCGLCKTLGKRYNQLVRLGLSYDMTFLAILSDSLSDVPCEIASEGCVKHIGNKDVCKNNKAIDYSTDVSILLAYHKLCDDIADEHSIKAYFVRLPYIRAFKKAAKKHPQLSADIKESLGKLSCLEADRCSSIDMAADPFAMLMAKTFGTFDVSLSPLGYNIGRFIYIADAYKDITSDIKNKSYNPYVCAYDKAYLDSSDFKKSVMGSLNMTLCAISDEYKQLKIIKNKEILDNIIYFGLRGAYDGLFRDNGGNK